jgi:hypothetical protein
MMGTSLIFTFCVFLVAESTLLSFQKEHTVNLSEAFSTDLVQRTDKDYLLNFCLSFLFFSR